MMKWFKRVGFLLFLFIWGDWNCDETAADFEEAYGPPNWPFFEAESFNKTRSEVRVLNRHQTRIHQDQTHANGMRHKTLRRQSFREFSGEFVKKSTLKDLTTVTPGDLRIPFTRNQLIRHTARVLDRYYGRSVKDRKLNEFEVNWDKSQVLIHNHNHSRLGNFTITQLIENLKGMRARRRRSFLKEQFKRQMVSNSSENFNQDQEELITTVGEEDVDSAMGQGLSSTSSSVPRISKKVSEVDGDIILGGLMMVHERGPDSVTCGPIMPQVYVLYIYYIIAFTSCIPFYPHVSI